MLMKTLRYMLFSVLLLAGCKDSTSSRDSRPPAAPRGLTSVTGDGEVFLHWVDNTENDLGGYHIYQAPCATGTNCPYDRIGSTTDPEFTVRNLANGVTRHFAVAAFDRSGNESDLSVADVFDTPRPEGLGRALDNVAAHPATSGYDFSDFIVRPSDNTLTDIVFGSRDGVLLMFTPFTDTEIQDAGYAASLDAVDFAPSAGWAPSGSVELIVGHCYVVATQEDTYAKFRVTSLDTARVVFDWAYQVDPGNRELRARPTHPAGPRIRRSAPWRA